MDFIKKTIRKRRFFAEYPEFGEEYALLNGFFTEAVERLLTLSERDATSRYTMNYVHAVKGGDNEFRLTFSRRSERGVDRKSLLVLCRDGYIKKYEEIPS